MKKSKILMPLTAVAAIGTVTPMIALSSCNKQEVTVTEITARTARTEYFVGETLTRADISVTATKSDGTKEIVKDWTCDEIGDEGYKFTKWTQHTFTIKYGNLECKLNLSSEYYGYLTFERILPLTLVKGTDFATEAAISVFGRATSQGGDLKEISLDVLDITSDDEDVVEYNKEKGTLVATGAGSATITAHYKGLEPTETTYDAELDVTVTASTSATAQITAATVDEYGGAMVALKTGAEIATDIDGYLNVPEYVMIEDSTGNATEYPVTSITAADGMNGIKSIVLPETLREIPKNMFVNQPLQTIIFDGTSDEWDEVELGKNWAGNAATGMWIYNETSKALEFSNFDAHHDAKYDTEAGAFIASSISGVVPLNQHTVGFSLDLAPDATTFSTINIKSSTILELGWLTVDAVYVDGVALTKTTHYTVKGGRYDTTITFVDAKKPVSGTNSNVLIRFTSPIFTLTSLTVTMK